MDKSALTEAMKASISEVLEQMFFIPIDFFGAQESCADFESKESSIHVKLGFSGSASGTFMLQAPVALAQSVSADFLGTTPQDLSEDQVAGTVLEMVNMLAGRTLSGYDHRALFDLQIPELVPHDQVCALTDGIPDRIAIGIQTPESRMTFQLILQ